MTWRPEYADTIPVRMRWLPDRPRESRRCPRTWPHTAHGPWHTGEIVPAHVAASFDCPGVPIVKEAS